MSDKFYVKNTYTFPKTQQDRDGYVTPTKDEINRQICLSNSNFFSDKRGTDIQSVTVEINFYDSDQALYKFTVSITGRTTQENPTRQYLLELMQELNSNYFNRVNCKPDGEVINYLNVNINTNVIIPKEDALLN